jgi:hypothetical protein
MTSFCNASISTPSNKSDPLCDARITLSLSRATDLEEAVAAPAVVEPLISFPILLMKDIIRGRITEERNNAKMTWDSPHQGAHANKRVVDRYIVRYLPTVHSTPH